MYKRLGGPQSLFGPYEEEKNLLPLLGIESLFFGILGHGVVTILPELSKLHLLYSELY
jgi:hypothetical protein